MQQGTNLILSRKADSHSIVGTARPAEDSDKQAALRASRAKSIAVDFDRLFQESQQPCLVRLLSSKHASLRALALSF